ncbi:hypothetical protein [Microvirga sesbaniae]|uniref:hypothetical protein n=1 Tax=Microvirga sesbaniae TaxID=681392 RepID=UPI0021CA892F|nr:hypothetical protein [Microvirga sp. HBU67692]
MTINTLSRSQRNENSRLPDLGHRPRIHTVPEEFGRPGSALARARNAGIIDNREFKAGQRMAALWQAAGGIEQQARLSAGRSLLALGENVALAVVSVCRDNCGVGNPQRATLLKQGLSKLASHFALTGDFVNV